MTVRRVSSRYEASDVHIVNRGDFVRIVRDSDESRVHLVPRETYNGLLTIIDESRDIAKKSLGAFSGLIHAQDREDMRIYLGTEDVQLIGEAKYEEKKADLKAIRRDFGRALNRAVELKDNGVPPIFDESFESSHEWIDGEGNVYHKFPTVDTIINLVTRETRPDRWDGRWGYCNPARLENIQKFSQYLARADNNAILEQLFQETYRISNFKDEETRSYVLVKVGEAFKNLRDKLAGFNTSRDVRTYDSNSDDVEDIVSNAFWFTQFDKPSVEAIMKDYWASFVSKGLESDIPFADQFRSVDNIARIFPHFVPANILQIEAQRTNIMHERRTKDAMGMDKSGKFNRFTKEFYETCEAKTAKFVRDAIGKRLQRKNSNGNLRTSPQFIEFLGVPDSTKNAEFYEELFGDSAIQFAGKMDLREFCEFAGDIHHRVAGSTRIIPYINQRIASDEFRQEFRDYWSERMTDDLFDLPPSRKKEKMGVEKYIFKSVVDDLIAQMELACVARFDDKKVVETLNRKPNFKAREQVELALARRVDALIGERVRAGEPIFKLQRELEIKHLPASFKRVLKGKELRPEPMRGRHYW